MTGEEEEWGDILVIRNIRQEGGKVLMMRRRWRISIMIEGRKYTEVRSCAEGDG